jgi:pilus assembly protein Flp/PilA
VAIRFRRIGHEKNQQGATLAGDFEMGRLLSRFLSDQSGATAIEYCLIAAGISITIVAVVNGMGTALGVKYTTVSTALK